MTGSDAGGGSDGGGGTDAGGTDAGGTDAGREIMCDSVEADIDENHREPHTMMVPVADVIAGVEQSYDITGESDHPHTVVVTADDFAMLAAGMSVTIESSRDDRHTHEVTLMCA